MTYFAVAAGLEQTALAVACGLTDGHRQTPLSRTSLPHEVSLRHVPLFSVSLALTPMLARRLALARALDEARNLERMEEEPERWDGLS